MICESLPEKLYVWLASVFDTQSRELAIPGRGRIPVDADAVQRVLGIPKKGPKINLSVKSTSNMAKS